MKKWEELYKQIPAERREKIEQAVADTKQQMGEPLPQPSPPRPMHILGSTGTSHPWGNCQECAEPSPPSAAPECTCYEREGWPHALGCESPDDIVRLAPQPAPNAPLQTERLASDAHQLAKDFDALVVLIARTLGDEEWQNADADQIREAFDPWDTLRKFKVAAPNAPPRCEICGMLSHNAEEHRDYIKRGLMAESQFPYAAQNPDERNRAAADPLTFRDDQDSFTVEMGQTNEIRITIYEHSSGDQAVCWFLNAEQAEQVADVLRAHAARVRAVQGKPASP